MKNIIKIVEQESFKVFPVVTNVKGGDCNKRYREDWVNACNKGVQIMKEMMESLKDFETWKEWRNTDPVVEWDDSHELSNVMGNMLADLDNWEPIPDNCDLYHHILDVTQTLVPINAVNHFDSHYSEYEIDDKIYRLTWKTSKYPIIQYKICL